MRAQNEQYKRMLLSLNSEVVKQSERIDKVFNLFEQSACIDEGWRVCLANTCT